jgi:hypothetical protein
MPFLILDEKTARFAPGEARGVARATHGTRRHGPDQARVWRKPARWTEHGELRKLTEDCCRSVFRLSFETI